MPRKEVNRMYHLGASTLGNWMRKYGSASYYSGKRKKFSALERNKIIAEVEQGRLTASEAQKKYKVNSGRTIHSWLYKSRHETPTFRPSKNKSMEKGNEESSSVPPEQMSNRFWEDLK